MVCIVAFACGSALGTALYLVHCSALKAREGESNSVRKVCIGTLSSVMYCYNMGYEWCRPCAHEYHIINQFSRSRPLNAVACIQTFLNHQRSYSFSSPAPLFNFIPLYLESRAPFPTSSHATQQPIRQSHEFGSHSVFPLAVTLYMLDGMAQHSPLAIKLKDEKSRKSILTGPLLADLKELAKRQPPPYARAACGPPAHNQLLSARPCSLALLFDHALRQDLQLHVADDRQSIPRDGRGP